MAKDLKLKIKNTQLAEALGSFKKPKRPVKKTLEESSEKKTPKKAVLFDASLNAKEVEPPVIEKTPATEKIPELTPAPVPTPVSAPVPTPVSAPVPTPAPISALEKIEEVKAPVIKEKPKGPVPPSSPPMKERPKRRPLGPVPVSERKPLGLVRAAPKPEREPPSAPAKPAFGKDLKSIKDRKFQDLKPRKLSGKPSFDGRARRGLAEGDDGRWRKRRVKNRSSTPDIPVQRPTELAIRLPIALKDLASEMKIKASQIIGKLMMQGMSITINDTLDDETTVQLIGHEFDCAITINTVEEKRLQVTDKTIREEISESSSEDLVDRPPVVAFMGHVDHGKTSIIDAIRKSNEAAGEAGAITQHIGAFFAQTSHGPVTILDTPGHEAFSAMRERGANATDIVVLVVAGDEGIREQTIEAISQAKASNVTIIVALNKSDKDGFNAENIYRQLTEQELSPEVWGGNIVTVNCSATTGEGIQDLVEMIGLQSEMLEIKADPKKRARGVVIESQMHKGLGAVATLLVQNGTLSLGDAVVFGGEWGRIKTMHNEHGKLIKKAGPSSPVKVTGLSSLPEAGSEFIVIEAGEKEARSIARARAENMRTAGNSRRKKTAEDLLAEKAATEKKSLSLILRADVQGSVEALEQAINKIKSSKVDVNVIATGVGEISESDIDRAHTSGAVIIGFHTKVEAHAETMIKEKKVQILLHNIIYHATDEIKEVMRLLLDKVREENQVGSAEIRAIFKSSHLGIIAGCMVTDGIIKRSHLIKLIRGGEKIWEGDLASIRRDKDDAKEVTKGIECGIVLQNFREVQEGDIIESYEVTYVEQDI